MRWVAALLALAFAAPAMGEVYVGEELGPEPALVRGAGGWESDPPRQIAEPPLTATPAAQCGPGSRPSEGLQGRVVGGEASAQGYQCNMELLGREGRAGGFKVERFVDQAGHECAYYDTTLVFPLDAGNNEAAAPSGVAVLDMTDPGKPVRTATLTTPAMLSPHESLLVNQKRGLLAAVMGNPSLYPGFIDVYDLNADCRTPELLSSFPAGLLGHESGWSPDGLTFYATSLFTSTVTAVDLTDPRVPVTLWVGPHPSHGFTTSQDGNRGYVAGLSGLEILDTSEIQARRPNPQVSRITRFDWVDRSIPQNAMPITIRGTPYLLEIDEFSTAPESGVVPVGNGPEVGAGRLIDISDERNPRIVSHVRLEVNQREHRDAVANDPGAQFPGQGYAGHYCGVPRAVDPGIVACSFILSGLRVFDIRDPERPREIAYFVAPPEDSPVGTGRTNYAMSRPSFAEERGEIWYSDANSGFYALKVTNGVWPFRAAAGPRCTRTIRVARGARVSVDGRRVRNRGGRVRVRLRGKAAVVRVRRADGTLRTRRVGRCRG